MIIENCGNEAAVTATIRNVAGIIGVNKGKEALIRMSNCYNTGTIVGGKESAGISGWLGLSADRIDYFLVSDRIKNKIIDARIDDTVLGSDHCPVVLEIDL